MPEAEASVGAKQIPDVTESLFTTLDLIIITILVGGIGYYFLNKRKQDRENAAKRTYSIQ